ncbi:MAG: AMP-binding protein [Actinomycetota bacterium]|nr:AMP-binding protein [Actinomycetota bacterium]
MIYRSERPDVEVPDVTLHEHVLAGAPAWGEKPALIDAASSETLSYEALAARVNAVAAGLQGRGIGKGDVVALIGGNSASWAIAYHAILTAGGIVTPINPLLTPDEVGKQLADSKARMLVAMGPLVEPLTPVAERCGVAEVLSLEDAMALGVEGTEPDAVEIGAEELAALPYSSGTTGAMKGVMLTHRNLVANIEQNQGMAELGPDDVLVGLLPFFHIYGQTVVLNHGLSKGATIVIMPRFDFDQMLEIVERHGVTRLHVAPPIVLALANAPQVSDRDFSKLGMVTSGAAPLDQELAERAGERIGAPVRQGYGMTELSPVTHWTPQQMADRVPAGSVGPLLPSTDARLVDPESGEDVAEGEQGELWIRGPQMMRGYLERPEATAETITDDGWLRTGDIARIDPDGNAYIVDRLKELIKYKGYQVPPAELEATLISHPSIKDAGVIGVPDGDGEEYPKAFIVCEGEVDTDEVMAYVAERVAPYKKVREVVVIDEVPKTASGKILRRVLRDEHGG